jgi:hypothetical protein
MEIKWGTFLQKAHHFVKGLKVWWQYATLFVYFSYFVTYIQSSNHIHTKHSPRPLAIILLIPLMCGTLIHNDYMYMGCEQGVTQRCRLSWLTNSALVYEPKCGRGCRGAGSQSISTAVHCTWSPNELELGDFL